MTHRGERTRVIVLGCGNVGRPVVEMLGTLNTVDVVAVVVWDPGSPKHRCRKADFMGSLQASNRFLSYEEFSDHQSDLIAQTDTVVELIGAAKDASGMASFTLTKDILSTVLDAGRNVVTANKTVVARWGPELFRLADESGCAIRYEGAVCGSIPIISLLREYWHHQPIRRVAGILNGTCNYVLTRMSEYRAPSAPPRGSDQIPPDNPGLEWALDEARRLGFAEADATADIDGHDAAEKLAILASLAFRVPVRPTEQMIPRLSLRTVTMDRVNSARERGCAIRQLAIAERDTDSLRLSVAPVEVPFSDMFASTKGPYNCVTLEGTAGIGERGHFGRQIYIGKGAGEATACAVLADLARVGGQARPNYYFDNPSIS